MLEKREYKKSYPYKAIHYYEDKTKYTQDTSQKIIILMKSNTNET